MTALYSTPYVDVIRLLVVIFIVTNQRNADGFDPNCPLLSLKYMESSTYSQNGEDGVIDALFSIIGVKDRYFHGFVPCELHTIVFVINTMHFAVQDLC